MRIIKSGKYFILLSLTILISCKHNINISAFSYRIIVSIPLKNAIGRMEIESKINAGIKTAMNPTHTAEIVILNYSSGAEVFSFSRTTKDNIKVETREGSMEALIKIKKSGKIMGIHFVKTAGSSRNEIISKLVNKLKIILRKPYN